MASIGLLRSFTVGIGASCIVAAPLLYRPNAFAPRALCVHCDSTSDSGVSPKDWSFSQYKRDAKAPVVSNGRINPRVWKQASSGSILGVLGGLAVSVFSKPLALLIGLLIVGVQFMESRGIHLIPYGRLQSYFSNINLSSAVQDNVAFKLSFGTTFALAAFAEL